MFKAHVSRAALHRLFDENGVWDGLRQGLYTCEPRDKKVKEVKAGHEPAGGIRVVQKWKDIWSRHTVTTHAVLDADGWPMHWDAKDIILGNTKYIHRRELNDS